jgi:hypothetical protein
VRSVWVATAFIDRCGVDLLKKAGSRGAQVRVLTSSTLNNADDWSGKVINFAHKELELHHIFPRGTDERTDSVANLTFISSVINKSIQNKHPHEYIFNELKLSPKVLEEHFMPVKKEYYTDFEKFISERASIIVSKGKKLLPDLFR